MCKVAKLLRNTHIECELICFTLTRISWVAFLFILKTALQWGLETGICVS
jgi:hypothetical protein